jgi:hypothetical protein
MGQAFDAMAQLRQHHAVTPMSAFRAGEKIRPARMQTTASSGEPS